LFRLYSFDDCSSNTRKKFLNDSPNNHSMSEEDLCPPWMPLIIHELLRRKPWPGPQPPNDGWPILKEVVLNLNMYVMSYTVADQKESTILRDISGKQLMRSVEKLTTQVQ